MGGLILANLAIALAAATQAASGLGFAMVAIPLLALIDLGWLPGPMLFANLFLSAAILWREGSALGRGEPLPLGAGLLIGTGLGAAFLSVVPRDSLGLLFGLVILAAVALALLAPQVPLRPRTILAGATASGFTGIVAAMHAPPLVMLYQREPPAKVRATFAVVFVIGCVLALGGLALSGRFGGVEARAGLSLLPGTALGYGAGRLVARRVSQGAARAAMLSISGAGGAMLVARSLW